MRLYRDAAISILWLYWWIITAKLYINVMTSRNASDDTCPDINIANRYLNKATLNAHDAVQDIVLNNPHW